MPITKSPGTGKGSAKGSKPQPEPEPTPMESVLLKEIREMKGMIGGMETHLNTRVTDLEKKVDESSTKTVAAVGTLEQRVIRNEKDLEPKINRALDAKIQSGAFEASIQRVVDKLSLIHI